MKSRTNIVTKKLTSIIFAIILCLKASPCLSHTDIEIDRIIKNMGNNSHIGIIISDKESNNVLYSRNINEKFFPASTLKLLSSYVAIKELGSDFKFKTSIFSDKYNSGTGQHHGSLYIKFDGDPSLQRDDIYKLISSILNNGDKELHSDIVIDDTMFEGPRTSPGTIEQDTKWYFATKLGAAIIDNNAIGITITSAPTLGGEAKVKFSDSSYNNHLNLDSNLKTVSFDDSEEKCQLYIDVDKDNLGLYGCWPISNSNFSGKVSVPNLREYIRFSIKQILEDNGINHSGDIYFNKVPEHANLISTHESIALNDMLDKVLSDSNNLYADAITLRAGANKYGKLSFKYGVKTIKDVIEHLPSSSTNHAIFDGSGLSRYNLLSPLLIHNLLIEINKDKDIYNILSEYLAAPGKGTLKYRFDNNTKLIAKTGTMSGSVGIVGYLESVSGRKLNIVILQDNGTSSIKDMRELEDQIINHINVKF